jgi:hypothetical protein
VSTGSCAWPAPTRPEPLPDYPLRGLRARSSTDAVVPLQTMVPGTKGWSPQRNTRSARRAAAAGPAPARARVRGARVDRRGARGAASPASTAPARRRSSSGSTAAGSAGTAAAS